MYHKSKRMINLENRVNKVKDLILNNKVSNTIKEAFYSFKTPYPEYLFSDGGEDYLVEYKKGKTEDNKVIVEFKTTPDPKFALDISKVFIFKKYYIRYIINKTSKEYGRSSDFRFKRFLTYR